MQRPDLVPHIRCRIGQAEDPPELKGKWFFEITIQFEGDPSPPSTKLFGPFETQLEAASASRECARVVADACAEAFGYEKTGMYYDLRDGGKLKKFETEH